MKHWEHPFLADGALLDDVWSRDREDSILFVAGSGFDPRASTTLEHLLSHTDRRVDGMLVTLPDDATDPAARPEAEANRARIAELIERAGGAVASLPLPDYEDRDALGRLVSHEFQRSGALDNYAEMVIEISAMPRSIFFPLVLGVLQRAHAEPSDALRWDGDLHVSVCESPTVDGSILELGTRAMSPIGGFANPRLEEPKTVIWVPVLGDGALERTRRLYQELDPDEVCPVLPLPAGDPRRGDRLILEHRQLLFDEIEFEPRNVIYAAERNPFDLYRTIGRLHERYSQALDPLGSVAMVLSSHSSKLLSVGVLLAAYERKLEVQHVSPATYGLDADGVNEPSGEVLDLWLTGEPYR